MEDIPERRKTDRMDCWKRVAVFAGGALFGSAGIRLLTSRDAKKAYSHRRGAADEGLRYGDRDIRAGECR